MASKHSRRALNRDILSARICLPLTKAFWGFDMIFSIITLNLFAKTLDSIMYIPLLRDRAIIFYLNHTWFLRNESNEGCIEAFFELFIFGESIPVTLSLITSQQVWQKAIMNTHWGLELCYLPCSLPLFRISVSSKGLSSPSTSCWSRYSNARPSSFGSVKTVQAINAHNNQQCAAWSSEGLKLPLHLPSLSQWHCSLLCKFTMRWKNLVYLSTIEPFTLYFFLLRWLSCYFRSEGWSSCRGCVFYFMV